MTDPVILRLVLKYILTECRIKLMDYVDAKHDVRSELAESDAILPKEIPRSATMCGWMLNNREANEYIRENSNRGY
jgi:hypothetical protein